MARTWHDFKRVVADIARVTIAAHVWGPIWIHTVRWRFASCAFMQTHSPELHSYTRKQICNYTYFTCKPAHAHIHTCAWLSTQDGWWVCPPMWIALCFLRRSTRVCVWDRERFYDCTYVLTHVVHASVHTCACFSAFYRIKIHSGSCKYEMCHLMDCNTTKSASVCTKDWVVSFHTWLMHVLVYRRERK